MGLMTGPHQAQFVPYYHTYKLCFLVNDQQATPTNFNSYTFFFISPHKLLLENCIHSLRVTHFIKNQQTYEGTQDKK
jgi:hypothetical protein